MKPEVAQDTSHSVMVTTHDFTPDPQVPWGLCKLKISESRVCNLSRAAHATGPVYVPTARKAVADGES